MYKVYVPMALLMSLILGSGLAAFTSNSASAQNYGYQDDYSYNSYSDSSYGDSYSKYPTEDKNYECRTGPFEGFFVSSVEFCKHIKFDKDDRKDNRDNNNNNGGTPGPQGPQGPQGPAGPAGGSGSNGAASVQIGFCNNTNFNVNGLAQGQTQRQNIDSNVKETSSIGQNLTNGTTSSTSDSTGSTEDQILNICFNINNNDLANATFTGGAGQAQTGTGGAGDTGTGGNIIR